MTEVLPIDTGYQTDGDRSGVAAGDVKDSKRWWRRRKASTPRSRRRMIAAGGASMSREGDEMAGPTIAEALAAWRSAERRWEATDPDDPASRAASIDVVAAWLAYQEATDGFAPGSCVLVTDDDRRYVAVRGDTKAILGYDVEDLIGRRIEDVAAADLAPATSSAWEQFLVDGRQEGEYRIRGADGAQYGIQFQARAHHPIPGYHLSRTWRAAAPTVPAEPAAPRELATAS